MKIYTLCAALAALATVAHSQTPTFQVVHSFAADGTQGSLPEATLTVGPDRALYGTTKEGGATGAGTAFRFSADSGFSNLGSFQIGTTGRVSRAQLVSMPDGFLYGATSLGTGVSGQPVGTVFKLNPAGGINSVFPIPGGGVNAMVPLSLVSGEAGILHVLGSSPGGLWRVPTTGVGSTAIFNLPTSGDSGIFPWRIMRHSDGNLYGITVGTSSVGTTPGRRGTIFRISPNGTGFTVLHDFQSETGVAPMGNMVEGPDGSLYGTTISGGANLDGVIFKLTTSGQYTVLHHVNDHAPQGDLLLASDGRLYGTSTRGGSSLAGSIFRINTNGTGYQVIYTFKNVGSAYPNGYLPMAGLVQADDGNLYGVTTEGGAGGKGTIFRIDLNLPTPAVNRPPVAVDDQLFSDGSSQVSVNVLANDFDPDDDALTVTIVSAPGKGTASVSGGNILYTPGGSYDGSDSLTYRVTDPDGAFNEAQVIIADQSAPAPWQPGKYIGNLNLDPTLKGETHTPRGQLSLNVTPLGLFTGTLFTGGKRLTVRGLFVDEGTAIASVKIPGKGTAILFLAPGESGSLIVAMFGREILSGVLAPTAVLDPAVKTLFTVALPYQGGDRPVGSGYASARIMPNGAVTFVGKFADGTKLSWGSTLSVLDSVPLIPVYSEPLRGGFCGGLFIGTASAPAFQASLRWKRPRAARATLPYPNGFSGDLGGVMDFYTIPPKGVMPVDFGSDDHGDVEVSGPTISTVVGGMNVVGTRLVSSAPLLSFAINRNTGLFTGKIKAGTRTVVFNGAVLQSLKGGFGYFTLDKQSGPAAFVAEP